ncbi:MAG: SOS response-associated peptidase family protein [Rhizomicrobium sp.]|nr:SOS response-associated peptidase family protein [Rhizomicrobium sp.]
MCGKFTQMLRWRELCELADLQRLGGVIETVTPMRLASVITLSEGGKRQVQRMRWGLAPPGSRDPAKLKPHIHARAETIDEKPAFRDAFRFRRGLLAVTTFNEGREITPTKTEQHVLTPKDGAPVGIAVIWERGTADNAGALLSFAMVTVPANPLIATITDRMPALIAADDWPLWLGEIPASLATVKALLLPSDRDLDMQPADKRKRSDQPDLF